MLFSYMISMGFILWMIAIMMWVGFAVIKSFESDLQREDTSESIRMNGELFINEYNQKNVVGRAVMCLWMGARMISILIGLLRKEKD